MDYAIYFSDLVSDVQQDVLDFYGLEKEEDGNFEICPLFILEVDNISREQELKERGVNEKKTN